MTPPSVAGGDRRALGQRAEAAAAAEAQRRGWTVVARNWRGRRGELDMIVRDGATWVAVEVRARRGAGAGTGLESVDRRKRARIVRTVAEYALRNDLADAHWRFDVCGVAAEASGALRLDWVSDAFSASD